MHRVHVTSDPPGATLHVGKKLVGSTPQDFKVWRVPFKPMRVRVQARGYRPAVVNLRKARGAAVEVLLIREHGDAGTWTSDDVQVTP